MVTNLFILRKDSITRVNYDPCSFRHDMCFCPSTKQEAKRVINCLANMLRYRMSTGTLLSCSETLETLASFAKYKHWSYVLMCSFVYALFCIWFSIDSDAVYIDAAKGRVYSSLKDIHED